MKHEIIHGDALDVLRTLDRGQFHTCVTSPPYFGLRDYGVDGQIGLERTPEEYIDRPSNVVLHPTVAGFKAGAGAKANGIGYSTEKAPTLSAVNSGTNQVPEVYDARGNGDGIGADGDIADFIWG